jgi:predicted TPR repeat methyltransferase
LPKGPFDASADEMLKRAHSLKDEAETKTLYRDWAATYDKTMLDGLGYLPPFKAAKLLTLNVADKQARILDVGTGTGLVGKELSTLGFNNIDGIDYSAEMLSVANNIGVYGELLEADLNKALAIESETYDAIICIGTFTHGHVGADCLDELFRVLKPGGKFITAIRKDYWEPAGFAEKSGKLEKGGNILVLVREEDSNYYDSDEPESWFIVWEKLH